MKKVILRNSNGTVIKEMPYGKENNFERIEHAYNIHILGGVMKDNGK